MIAMAIMVMALASIFIIEDGAIRATDRTKRMNEVAMLARNKMIETEFKIEGKTFEEVKKEDGGTFPTPYEQYQWRLKIREIKFPNLVPPSAGKGDGDAGGGEGDGGAGMSGALEMMSKLVTNYLSKALREITVTIAWSKAEQEQTFSVSTYWVNLNHEFQLSE